MHIGEDFHRANPNANCVFCLRVKRKQFMKTSRDDVVAFEPLDPVVPGHMLFIPVEHRDGPLFVGQTFAIAQMYGLNKRHPDIGPDFNLIINQGPAAGQTIDHPHVHYVPRWEGDGLHLPWWDQEK